MASEQFWYATQERAFAPDIADGWPKVIQAPHSPHGRLVRRAGDPDELLTALKALVNILDRADAANEACIWSSTREYRDALIAIAKAESPQ